MENLNILQGLISCAEILLFFIGIYYLSIAIFSLTVSKKQNISSKIHTFAILIAAHNEENVICDIVESLKKLKYPKECFDIFVIADNCTDHTAELAKNSGAQVMERFNNLKKGKGFAIEYAFANLFSMDKQYNDIVILDADNVVSEDFLHHMNNKLNEGYGAVQGYLDSKNPYDSWLTFSYSLWYWINNRVAQLSRGNLDMGCRLGGTGLAISTDLIKEFGWGATCLAEDTEFTLKLALKDIKVGWAHDAVVYDEKPLHMKTSWNQRTRWMQGLSDVGTRFIRPLMKKGIEDQNMFPIHMVLNFWGDTLYPACVGFFTFVNILKFLMQNDSSLSFMFAKIWVNPINSLMLSAFVWINVFVILFGLYQDKKLDKRIIKNCIGFLVYIASWIPIGLVGFFKKDETEWFHTPHNAKKDKE